MTFNLGWNLDTEDSRDYIYLTTLYKLYHEILRLDSQGIKIGEWKPIRDDNNNLKPAKQQIVYPLTNALIQEKLQEIEKSLKEQNSIQQQSVTSEPLPVFIPIFSTKVDKTIDSLKVPATKSSNSVSKTEPISTEVDSENTEERATYHYHLDLKPKYPNEEIEKENKEIWTNIIDETQLKSCTADASVSLLEYFERKASRQKEGEKYIYEDIKLSNKFLYKITRNLLGYSGDSGATLRATMEAMRIMGVAPEQYYSGKTWDDEPSAFCYAIAQKYRSSNYFRLDKYKERNVFDRLDQIKVFISAGFPAVFGFWLTESNREHSWQHNGEIPFTKFDNPPDLGHAVIAIGYDDNKKIEVTSEQLEKSSRFSQTKNFSVSKGKKLYTKGAFQIRNSWGEEWGDEGCGWLPYTYLLEDQASDWWSIVKTEWLDTGEFGFSNDELLGCNPPVCGPPRLKQ